MQVKPLLWEDNKNGCFAAMPGFDVKGFSLIYEVLKRDKKYMAVIALLDTRIEIGQYKDMDRACRACQIHLSTIIRHNICLNGQ